MPKNFSVSGFGQTYSYVDGSEELRLVQLADAASNNDGRITLGELDALLAAPHLPELVSTETISAAAKLMDTKSRLGKAVKVTSIPKWARAIAEVADASFGDRDGKLTKAELLAYTDATKTGATTRLTSQRLAILRSQIARVTTGKDVLDASGGNVDRELDRKTFRVGYNDSLRIPMWVSYSLSAADASQRKPLRRMDAFRGDPELVKAGVGAIPAWYERTGYDMGHQKPYDDYDTETSARDSFLMSNIAPQTPQLNGQSWRILEDGVRQLVAASGGKAAVFTGGLFLDENLQPLPKENVQRIGPDAFTGGPRTVAVPTHFWKAVHVTLPNGRQTMFSYLIANRNDLPVKKEPVAELLARSMVSVGEIERLSGLSLFAGLNAGDMKAKTNGLTEAVTAIMKQTEPVVTPVVPEPVVPAGDQNTITPLRPFARFGVQNPAPTPEEVGGPFADLALLWPAGVTKPAWVR